MVYVSKYRGNLNPSFFDYPGIQAYDAICMLNHKKLLFDPIRVNSKIVIGREWDVFFVGLVVSVY